MAGKKSNIRSIRFSDEIAEMIDAQIGDTFTEKFTNLITKCCWELPGKEEELKRLQAEIDRKRKELVELSSKAQNLKNTLYNLSATAGRLESLINQEAARWGL